MLALIPSSSLLALPPLGLLVIALALVLTGRMVSARRFIRRAISQPFNPAARLAARLDSALAAVIPVAARDASAAPPVAVEVLVEDRALRNRVRRRARTVLVRCIATMGAPPANCAVLIATRLERDGRPVRGCVERLTDTDGTIRTIISLSLEVGPDAPTSDAIAARLAGYYLVATGAERTVLSVDPLQPVAQPAIVAATRVTPPEAIGVVPLSVVAGVKRA